MERAEKNALHVLTEVPELNKLNVNVRMELNWDFEAKQYKTG